MVESYKQMFNENPPSKANSPLDSNDHPEVNTSKFLDEDSIQQYQSLIGSMQWAISIGRFDIAVHVMSMSSFRTSPWRGHLNRAKCMVSYLYKFRLARYEYLPTSLIIQILRGLNMIRPSLSMVTYQRLSPRILPLLLEASSH
jgi:hypothetical protein